MIHLPGNRIHQPPEHESDSDEGAENLGAVNRPFARRVFAEDPEHHGDEERKQKHRVEVGKSQLEFSDKWRVTKWKIRTNNNIFIFKFSN